jgi:hypothetical protein
MDRMNMSNLNQTADVLALEQLENVNGGRGEVVIIGCTTRPPMGGYPPGTVTWNPWIGQPYPQPI